MNFLVDFVLIAIIAFFTIASYRKGFVKTLVSGVKNVVAFAVAYAFAPRLGDWLKQQFVMEKAKDVIKQKVSEFIGSETVTASDVSKLITSDHGEFASFIERMGVDNSEIAELANSQNSAIDVISERIAEP